MARNWYLYAPSHHRSSASFCTYIGSPISRSISSWCRGMNLCRPRCVASRSSSWVNGTPPLPSKWKKQAGIDLLVILIRSKTIYNTNNNFFPTFKTLPKARIYKLVQFQQFLAENLIIKSSETHTYHKNIVCFTKFLKIILFFLSKIRIRFNCVFF